MSEPARIQVLLSKNQAAHFDDYCRRKGFKKSTLIARLVREHLEQEDEQYQAVGCEKTKESEGPE